jgi:hypothetical protein
VSLLLDEPGLRRDAMDAAHNLLEHFATCKVCNWNAGRDCDGNYLYLPCSEAVRLRSYARADVQAALVRAGLRRP